MAFSFKQNKRKEKQMKNLLNKTFTATILIASILMISMVASLFLPLIYAQTINRYTSNLYVGSNAKLIGLGQQVLLVYWTAEMPPDIGETAGTVSSPTTRAGWDGVIFTVIKPDGTNETKVMTRSDPVGGGFYQYIPEQTGTYSFQAILPETWKNTTTTKTFYSSAISNVDNFTVQTEPISTWQENPLPNIYWTRPINTMNRDWYVLAGNWLGGAALLPSGAAGGTTTRLGYGQGPESAHIAWTKPYYVGGIMDERIGNIGFQTHHYNGLIFRNPIVIDGIIYYAARAHAHLEQGYNAVDLYTGQTLNFYNATAPAFGSIYNYDSPNQHGGLSYLWRTSGVTITNPGGVNGTVWEMLDAYTGNSITKIANVTSGGTAVYGKDGSILRYNLVNLGTTAAPNYYLQVWNASAIPTELLGTSGTNYWQWRPERQAVHNGINGFSLNVSISSNYMLGPRNSISNQTSIIRTVRESDVIIIGTAGQNDERGVVQGYLVGLNLKPGQVGTKLWDITFTPPSSAGNQTIDFQGVDPEDGVFIFGCAKKQQTYVYSLATGQQLWMSEPEPAFNYYYWTTYDSHRQIYNGMLISGGYSGVLTAYNITNGDIIWTYTAENVGLDAPYGNIPVLFHCIADGKIYIGSSEHSPTQPLWRNPHALGMHRFSNRRQNMGIPGFWRRRCLRD